jgi:uracil-DNA glycosylase
LSISLFFWGPLTPWLFVEVRRAMQKITLRSVVQRLESLERAGVTHVKKASKKILTPHKDDREPKAVTGACTDSCTQGGGPGLPAAKTETPPVQLDGTREAALATVARDVAACTRCHELARTRTQTVFGVGNPHARLVFCGEAPGADEDRVGEPFVGRAGQLLTDIIVKGMKIRREDVYILNILRCRPPANRTPLPEEAANCREYLERQLAIIQPKFICCLGAVAAQNLLKTETPIGQLRGRVHNLDGIKVICTYHPAYLLRNPPAKKYVWEDIKMLMAEMK